MAALARKSTSYPAFGSKRLNEMTRFDENQELLTCVSLSPCRVTLEHFRNVAVSGLALARTCLPAFPVTGRCFYSRGLNVKGILLFNERFAILISRINPGATKISPEATCAHARVHGCVLHTQACVPAGISFQSPAGTSS
jgi:hypothetical protein